MLDAGTGYGSGGAARSERILLEFVSANPTGPIVAASGRHAAYGDSLARILAHHGHSVQREYYVNDAGSQVLHLGESVRARALGQEPPKDGYQGDYVADLAVEIPGAGDESLDIHELTDRVVAHMLVGIKATMERYGVAYDRYFSERTLHEGSPSLVQRSLDAMRAAGHIYESDDATWLRTPPASATTRTVCWCAAAASRPTSPLTSPTCRASASAASSARSSCSAPTTTATSRALKAAFEALGGDPELLETQIMQMVHLVENDERTRMSKRRGEFVTLDSLLDEIGVDATRFFHAAELARPHARPRPRPRPLADQREPGLLRAVRARADRLDPGHAG